MIAGNKPLGKKGWTVKRGRRRMREPGIGKEKI